jgi:hypothetical protein
MALSDIFTVPFLVSLGITLLLVGLLGMFVVQRIQEQNHKMASMLGLVSTMAEELNFIRGRMQIMTHAPQTGGLPVSQEKHAFSQNSDVDNLIPVSDGENDSDSEDDSEDDSENDSGDDEEDSEESSLLEFISPIENVIELNPNEIEQHVKIINFGELVNSQFENVNEGPENLDEIQDLDDMGDLDDDSKSHGESDEETETETETETKNVINFDAEKNELSENATQEKIINFIKSIDISNLEEHSDSGNIDYKKMSMAKLKSVAVAKGLIQENSKATKNAILKMLNFE